ncbi:MAG: O-antigen ligase family protein [candidate division KSB1 bacterium]|nr:O-antigen ligase family protein [candidate division KSB1 bacterium]
MLQIIHLIFFFLFILQPALVALGFQESRFFSVIWLMVFLGLVIGRIIERKHDFPRLNFPLALLIVALLTVAAIHGFEPKLLLNAGQFLIAVLTMYFLIYYVIFYEDEELFFAKVFASIPFYFYAALLISTVLTAYNAPDAPLLYVWQCNGIENRAQLMYGSGNHFGVYLSALTLISAVYLVAQKRYFHILTIGLAIGFLVISGSRTGQVAIVLLPILLIFRLLRLHYGYLLAAISLAGVIIYLIVFNNDLYYYVYQFFLWVHERVPLRFMPEARYHLLAGREVLWNTLVEMIRSKPIWGHGYYIPFYDFGIDAGYEGGRLVGNETAPTSESGLLFTVRYGVPATIVYLWFMVSPLLKRTREHFEFYHVYLILFAFCVWILNDSLFISYSIQILFFLSVIAGHLALQKDAIALRRYELVTKQIRPERPLSMLQDWNP